MEQKTAADPHILPPKKQTACKFYGMHPDGRFRIKVGKKRALISGSLYELTQTNTATENGKARLVATPISTTPGSDDSSVDDECFTAVCQTTGKRLRVIGSVKYLIPRLRSTPVLDSDGETKSTRKNKHIAPDSKALSALKRSRPKRNFVKELKIIAAQRAAGLDPYLRLWFITIYLGQSRATLYRKMGKQFPIPIKRGRNSYWPMTVIEAYKAGTFQENQHST